MKIVVLKKRNQWYWKLVARNGRILAHSETYSSKAKAVKTAIKIFTANEAEFKIVVPLILSKQYKNH